MKCNNCGSSLLEKDKFCSKCGTKVEQTKTPVAPPVTPPKKTKQKPYWLIMLIPVVIYILSVIFSFIVSIITYEYELYMDPVYYLFDILNAIRIINFIVLILCIALTVFLYVKTSKKN